MPIDKHRSSNVALKNRNFPGYNSHLYLLFIDSILHPLPLIITHSPISILYRETGPIISSRSHYSKRKRSCLKVRTGWLSPNVVAAIFEASTQLYKT